MPPNLFYTMVQKSQKWPKTQIKGVLRKSDFCVRFPHIFKPLGFHCEMYTVENMLFSTSILYQK